MTTGNRVCPRHVISNVSGRYNPPPPFIHTLKKSLNASRIRWLLPIGIV